MSFGWSAGDIVSAINTFITIGQALRESGGSKSEYQAAVTFLESVEKTLTGVLYIVRDNPDLPCEESLLEQVNVVRSAIEGFEKKFEKYKNSLDAKSERGKLKAAPRAIQFALSDVKELQRDIERPQGVLNSFISLQTLLSTLEISRTSELNLKGTQKLAEDLFQLLPNIANGVNTLDRDLKFQLQDVSTRQQQSEISLRNDLKQLQRLLTDINTLQISADAENKASSATQKEWHEEIRLLLQNLADCSKNQLDFLLKKEMEPKRTDSAVDDKTVPAVLSQVLLLIGNGIAGAVGGYVALRHGRESWAAHEKEFPTLTTQASDAQFFPPRHSGYSFGEIELEKAISQRTKLPPQPIYTGSISKPLPAKKDVDFFSDDAVDIFRSKSSTNDELNDTSKSISTAQQKENMVQDQALRDPMQSEVTSQPQRRQTSNALKKTKHGGVMKQYCKRYELDWEDLQDWLSKKFPELKFASNIDGTGEHYILDLPRKLTKDEMDDIYKLRKDCSE